MDIIKIIMRPCSPWLTSHPNRASKRVGDNPMKDQSKSKQTLIQKRTSTDDALEYAENIIDTVREPLIALDQDLRVVKVSRSFYEFFKVKPEETVGQYIYDLGNQQWNIPKLRELLETILPQKTTFDNYEVEHEFTTIGKRTMLLNARQIQRVLGKERIILLAIEDITERKQLENLLKDSEELYKGVFNNAADGIVLLEKAEGKIIHINPSAEKLLGYSAKESIGNKLQDIGFIFGIDDFQTIMQNLNKNGIINYIDVPLTTKSGQHMNSDVYIVDKTKVIQCNIRDVNERELAKDALRNSERRLREVLENSLEVSYKLNLQTNHYDYLSPVFTKLSGYDSEEIKSMSFEKIMDFIHPDDHAEMGRVIAESMSGAVDTGYQMNYRFKHKDGQDRWCQDRFTVMRDADGQQLAIIGSVSDITERKQAEDALRESEKKYRIIAENTADQISILDMNMHFTYVSPTIMRLRGLTVDEAMGQTLEQVLTPESMRIGLSVFEEEMQLEASGEADPDRSRILEVEEYKKDGATIWVEVNFSFVRDNDGKPVEIIMVSRNITERKEAEEQLKETLESLRKALGATIHVMVTAVEMRDPYTAGHQLRVSNLARDIATEMGLSQNIIEGIRMAGSIHDIGRLSIPAEILTKPTKLTNTEFALIKDHSLNGYEMLKNVESPWPLAQIVYQHHERMNGSGYPRNLKGDEILMEARIMAVADVVEAMASHRPYRPSLGIDAALAEIEKNKGTFFDNAVADACLKLFREKGYQLT
jgi:PAS domain S-box-containing protein